MVVINLLLLLAIIVLHGGVDANGAHRIGHPLILVLALPLLPIDLPLEQHALDHLLLTLLGLVLLLQHI